MVFSNSTTKLGLIEKIDFLLFGNSAVNTTEYPLADKTRDINQWYRTVMGWIFEVAGNWSFDDSNYTTLPFAKKDCTLGQKDYSFPTDMMEFEEVHYKDASGIWHKLLPLDRAEINGGGLSQSGVIGGIVNQASEEFLKTNGTPKYYDKSGNSYYLYPAADRTSTDGDSIRVYHTRDASNTGTASAAGGPFVSTDTIKEPGFNRLWHPVLAYGAAYEYAMANSRTDKISAFLTELGRYQQLIKEFYAGRKKDERIRLQVNYQNNK